MERDMARDTATPGDYPLAKNGKPFNRGQWLTIVCFFVCICVPGLLQLMGLSGAFSDNRAPAPPPAMPTGWQDALKLPQQTQAYLDDKFGLRSQLVRLNSLLRYKIGVSTTPSVAIGKNDFLFYAYEPERLMEQHIGQDVFSQKTLDAWLTSIAANAAWLAERNIAYYVVVAPDKSTIYPEFLPDYPPLPNSTTRLDQITDALKTRNDIVLIDPRAAIEAQKTAHRMYPLADSHWGQRSALVTYSLLMDRIQQKFPASSRVTIEDYDIRVLPSRGDLAFLLNLYDDVIHPEEQLQLRGKSHVLATEQMKPAPDWGWPVKKIRTDREQSPRIVIQGDSFTDYVMGPLFLYETFRETSYVHHNGTMLNKALIEDAHPDIVVLELAERYLAIP